MPSKVETGDAGGCQGYVAEGLKAGLSMCEAPADGEAFNRLTHLSSFCRSRWELEGPRG